MSPAEMRACRDRPEPFSIVSEAIGMPCDRYQPCSHCPATSGASAPCPFTAAISSSSIRVITLLLNLLIWCTTSPRSSDDCHAYSGRARFAAPGSIRVRPRNWPPMFFQAALKMPCTNCW